MPHIINVGNLTRLSLEFPLGPGFWGTGWAEQAYVEGLIPSCGTDAGTGKPKFCPNAFVSRGFGESVIVNAKNLTMP